MILLSFVMTLLGKSDPGNGQVLAIFLLHKISDSFFLENREAYINR
jgi:hypothetical protein